MRRWVEPLLLTTLLSGCTGSDVRFISLVGLAAVILVVLFVVAVVNIIIDEVRVRADRRPRHATRQDRPDPPWPS